MGPDRAVVEIHNDGFHPLTALIRLGGTVRWVNKDTVAHTVHFPGSPDGDTAPIPPGSFVEAGFKASKNYYATDQPRWIGTVGIVGTERRADGLIYPLNFDHQVNFGSTGKADGDYQKGPTAPSFVTSPAWAWTTMVQPPVAADGTITLVIDKAQSWVDVRIDDPRQTTPDSSGTSAHERLRRHEQVHFDLTALFLRDFLNGGARLMREGWTRSMRRTPARVLIPIVSSNGWIRSMR